MTARAPVMNQFDLRRAVDRDRSLSACARACAAEIMDWFHADYGDAWICHDILVDKTGFSRPQVIRSVKRLLEIGYISLSKKGTRGVGARGRDGDKGRGGNRYQLNLSLGCKKQKANNPAAISGIIDDTLNLQKCSIMDDTSNLKKGIIDDTSNQKCSIMDDTHSYLQDGPTRDGPGGKSNLCEIDATGAASPLPLAPLAGAAAGTPVELAERRFEALRKAYAVLKNSAKAKREFDKLNPANMTDAEFDVILASAKAWTEFYRTQNDNDQKCRVWLQTWIVEKKWLDEPHLPYVKKEPKAKATPTTAKGKTNATTTTPTADVRREVSDAEKMKRVAEYARATGDTIDDLREIHCGEHDDDLYSAVWDCANLEWPIGVPAPSWVVGGGKLPEWTDGDAWADLAIKIDCLAETALYRRAELAGGWVDYESGDYHPAIHLPAELAGHHAVADIIKSANALYIDVHVGDVAYPHTGLVLGACTGLRS